MASDTGGARQRQLNGSDSAPPDPATNSNQSGPPQSGTVYKSAAEYTKALQQWIWQYHMHNQMQSFYMNMSLQAMSCMSGASATGGPPQRSTSWGNFNPPASPQPAPAAPVNLGTPPRNIPPQSHDEFKIPRLWKRVVAEFIDFFILFIVKLAVTIMTVEYVGIIDLERYDIEQLMRQNLDYNAAFAITSELVAMEIINRIFICIFETLCLRRGMVGMIGGTTPGKRIMGIKVVSCDTVTSLGGSNVRVTPAGNIGTWNAFVRSIIKNFSLAFFFPVCFTVFFFQHNRAAYDVISNCIVVEATEEDRQLYRRR